LPTNLTAGDEAVALADYGLHEMRTLGIVTQGLAYFANGGVDTVLGLNENARASEFRDDALRPAGSLRIGREQPGNYPVTLTAL